MGGGSRHSKNAGTMGCEGMSYHERKALHFGTVKERLGKDTVKDFDACGLSLSLATDPVCTADGIIYQREAILENLVKQKKAIARQMTAWEAQQSKIASQEVSKAAADQEAKLVAFHSQNHGAGKWEDVREGAEYNASGEGGAAKSATMTTEFERKQASEMKAFWLPSKTPEARKLVDKPDTATKCPCTGKKLRLKELVDVKWTPAPKDATGSRFMCPTCKRCFTNSSRIVVLKCTGDAMCADCCSTFVEKDGNYNGKKVKKKDIIHLARGGTGFIASGTQVEAKRFEHLGVGSGMADVRGQSAGPRSAFGLTYR
mmetsp:Transcript_49142/g.93873  ORF Transcript_49142/g.93873 Transcript_49142/m.93873 type:complete len:315 (-) Transcript_49142:258-1202(-)|eukprot:CAMPEP_0114249690 /NCGR_PEP_ID=MMETSP0058-20121206/14287_1 /TAXON_ID=36894 /ORGANISM="Pyramimonas parkeae, CCMP726" /LENGTH=314 /DNA_ID=CAMNT_0001363273 /DNA_START=179 /DNA_END=1123 /DNA_ORIENTATION=+